MIPYRYLAKIFLKPYPDIIWKYPPYENTVYLTFDDGPYPPLTKPLLEMLRDIRGVPLKRGKLAGGDGLV